MKIEDSNLGDSAGFGSKPSGDEAAVRRKKTAPIVKLDSAILSDVDVKLTTILGHGCLTFRELLNLADGDVLNLDTPLDGMVDITLNNKIVAKGEIVAVGDRFGVRISKIVADQA